MEAQYAGKALPNALVTFTAAPGQGSFARNSGSSTTSNSLSVVTGANGYATVYYLLPPTLRNNTILAKAGTAQPVTFIETSATPTPPAGSLVILSVVSGEGQTGPAGQTLPQPFIIQATNSAGQPVAQSLNLAVTQGGGGLSNSSTGSFASSLQITTSTSGQATVYLQPGGSVGTSNMASCASTGAATVYLTALTGATNSAPSPTGGTAPTVDPNTQTPWYGQVSIVEADEDNGMSPQANPDPTRNRYPLDADHRNQHHRLSH